MPAWVITGREIRRFPKSFLTISGHIFRLLCSVLVAGAFLCPLEAQTLKPVLRGKVLDPAGAPLVGARITAVSDDHATKDATVSNQSGEFSLPLESGNYIVEIAAQ